jgi:hypothetical protein
MPRIAPSRVVEFIDKVLLQGTNTPTLGRGNAGQLRALVELVDKIPEELLTMDSDSYAGLICGVGQIREALAMWVGGGVENSRRNLDAVPGFSGATAVALIRAAVKDCPDEAPAPSTAELKFITDPKLQENLRTDMGVVYRAIRDAEWKAATVLAGSVIEALLLWNLTPRPSAQIASAIKALMAAKQLRTNPDPNDLERWNLYEYIQVAERLKVITPNTAIQARLAKDFRNFIHPGVTQRIGEKCDQATAFSAAAGMLLVVRDLTPP